MTFTAPLSRFGIPAAAGIILLSAGCAGIWSFLSSSGPEWLLFDTSRLRDYYYNPASVERLSQRIVKVRIAAVIKSEEGRNWEVSERMKRGLTLGGYENYQSSQDVYVVDCTGKEYRLISGADYDDKSNMLGSYERPDSPWEPIPSGSVLDTLITFKSVCP